MPKQPYRFCGAESVIGDIKLSALGQTVYLTDEEARDAILGGCCILPEEQFQKLGFTEHELQLYPTPLQQMSAPDSFKNIRSFAWSDFAKLQDAMREVV